MADDGTTDEDERPRGRSEPAKSLLPPAVKSSLLWGVVGGLSFLVLAQGYELLAGLGVGFTVKLAVALVVAAVAAVSTHVTRGRLLTENESH